jgi:hypothetical protein
MSGMPQVRAGWSHTRLPVTPDMVVLDLGSGAFPNARADVLCDMELVDNRHRAGLGVVIDRTMVVADAAALPFRDGGIDYVIVSHLAEHIEDPEPFCVELARVARAGYIETPSPLADLLLHEDYHLWRVGRTARAIVFNAKGPRSARTERVGRVVYKAFYAAQPSCAQETYRLPDGIAGRILAMALRAFGGVLNRVGVMHTRYTWDPLRPLAWEVRDTTGVR